MASRSSTDAVQRAVFPIFPVDARVVGPGAEQAEREEALARARADGFAAGQREGREAAFAQWSGRLAAATATLEAAAEDLAACRRALGAEVERQLPRLLLLLARKVLDRELSRGPAIVETVIGRVTAVLAGIEGGAVLRVAPEVADALVTWRGGMAASAPDPAAGPCALASGAVRIAADPALARGDWMLETRDGFLDGRLESQLDEAWRMIGEGAA